MEDHKNFNRLQTWIAFGALFGLISIYLLILSNDLEDKNGWKLALNVLPNLIAALIVVISLYFFFVKHGMSSQSILINEIVSRVKASMGEFSFQVQSEVVRKFDLKEKMKTARKIQVMGYSCRYLIAGLRHELKEALLNNTNLEFILIKPKSDAANLLMKNQKFKEIEFDLDDALKRIKEIENDIEKSGRKRIGTIEVRFINWIPSCSMVILTPKKRNTSKTLKLKIYAPDNSTPLTKIRTHMLISENDDQESFNFFEDQFNSLWIRAAE